MEFVPKRSFDNIDLANGLVAKSIMPYAMWGHLALMP